LALSSKVDRLSDVKGFTNAAMDRAASYVAGSRHKDNCHWLVNGQVLNVQSSQTYRDESPTLTTRMKTLSRCMSVNKHKTMASEYLAEQQAEGSKDNELAA
jgi:hypothetical protein